MKRRIIALAAGVAVLGCLSLTGTLPRLLDLIAPSLSGPRADEARYPVIKTAIAAAGSGSVIVFGDSIVQQAVLPASVCGRPLVNAGVGGATVDDVARRASMLLGDTRPDLIVLAVGINDAWRSMRSDKPGSFDRGYRALLQQLAGRAPVVIATLTGIKDGPFAADYDASYLDPFNRTIRTAAGATVIVDLAEAFAAGNLTSDGIHLTEQGYAVWLPAILNAAESALHCR